MGFEGFAGRSLLRWHLRVSDEGGELAPESKQWVMGVMVVLWVVLARSDGCRGVCINKIEGE